MALTMRGYSPGPSAGFNGMGAAPGARASYPGIPDGYAGPPGALPMAYMEPGPMGELGPPLMRPGAVGAGLYQQQPRQPRYRDFSRVPVEDTSAQEEDNSGSGAGKEPPFPVKLHKILSNPEFQEYITWLPHGRSWRVLKPKAFEEKVIPLYFRHAKYASFMRQVNGWGFKRMTQGPDHNSYYHEMFLRGLPQVCSRMRRSSRTKNPMIETDAHPDFYRISMFAPLPMPGSSAPAAGDQTSKTAPTDGHASDTEEASSERNREPKSTTGEEKDPEEEVITEPVHSSTNILGGPPPSLAAGSFQQLLQNQQDIEQNRIAAKGNDPNVMRKDMTTGVGGASPGLGPHFATPPEGVPLVGMGHPGLPMPIPFAGDPMMASQAAAAQVQYEQQLMAGAPGAALMTMAPPNLMAFQQNQALQNQALLAQLQAQMVQVQDQLPPAPDGPSPRHSVSSGNPPNDGK